MNLKILLAVWKVRRRRSALVGAQNGSSPLFTHRVCGVTPIYTEAGGTTLAETVVGMTFENDDEQTQCW